MITKIIMPQLGTTMTEGTVDLWQKHEGDAVKKGEILLEISTDKYTSGIECEADGFLRRIVVPEGEDAPVLAVLGLIADTMEEPLGEESAGGDAGGEQQPSRPAQPEAGGAVPAAAEEAPEKRIRATPLARKTAADLGVDLADVTTGHVRIKQEDVLRHHEKKAAASAAKAAAAAPAKGPGGPEVVQDAACKPLTPMRRAISARMTESIVTAPQVTEMREVCADALMALRGRIRESHPEIRVSYGDIIAKLVATALVNLPAMNASWTDQGIRTHEEVNIGVAVALDDGLVVPVVRHAERKGILQIAQESAELIKKARDMKLGPDESAGATFTISNLGGFGVDGFTPIVDLPECGILGLGRIVRKPVVDENDQVVPGNVMMLSLTFDHRVVDGATAAKLLARIAQYIEKPETVLL